MRRGAFICSICAPLAWTHAQFVRLAWSIDKGEPVERPSIVTCRCTGSDC